MKIERVMAKMIEESDGNLHDIAHFMKVWGYAHLIAVLEGVAPDVRETLEIAAIVHDIACPVCRLKYGNTDGKNQEMEGPILADNLLTRCGIPESQIDRICWLVGHHHTYFPVDGIDHQILLEADYLVNAHESEYSPENIESAREKVFATKTGRSLLDVMYRGVQEGGFEAAEDSMAAFVQDMNEMHGDEVRDTTIADLVGEETEGEDPLTTFIRQMAQMHGDLPEDDQ